MCCHHHPVTASGIRNEPAANTLSPKGQANPSADRQTSNLISVQTRQTRHSSILIDVGTLRSWSKAPRQANYPHESHQPLTVVLIITGIILQKKTRIAGITKEVVGSSFFLHPGYQTDKRRSSLFSYPHQSSHNHSIVIRSRQRISRRLSSLPPPQEHHSRKATRLSARMCRTESRPSSEPSYESSAGPQQSAAINRPQRPAFSDLPHVVLSTNSRSDVVTFRHRPQDGLAASKA